MGRESWAGFVAWGIYGLTFLIVLHSPALPRQDRIFGSHGMAGGPGAGADDGCIHCHAGEERAGGPPEQSGGRTTVACLACHDGTLGTDVVANMPLSRRGLPGDVAIGTGRADHPVGIPLTVFSGAIATDSSQIAHLRQTVIDGRPRWWIDAEPVPNGERDATDLILYTRYEAGGATPFIECATCHDPHADAVDGFLRMPNTSSRLCRACHDY